MTLYFDLSNQTITPILPNSTKILTLTVAIPNQITVIAGLLRLAIDLPPTNGYVEVLIPTE